MKFVVYREILRNFQAINSAFLLLIEGIENAHNNFHDSQNDIKKGAQRAFFWNGKKQITSYRCHQIMVPFRRRHQIVFAYRLMISSFLPYPMDWQISSSFSPFAHVV